MFPLETLVTTAVAAVYTPLLRHIGGWTDISGKGYGTSAFKVVVSTSTNVTVKVNDAVGATGVMMPTVALLMPGKWVNAAEIFNPVRVDIAMGEVCSPPSANPNKPAAMLLPLAHVTDTCCSS